MLECANCGQTFTSIVDSIGHLCPRKNLAAALPAMTHPTEQSDRERAEKLIEDWRTRNANQIIVEPKYRAELVDAIVAHNRTIRREALLAAAKDDAVIECMAEAAMRHVYSGLSWAARNEETKEAWRKQMRAALSAIRNLIDGGK